MRLTALESFEIIKANTIYMEKSFHALPIDILHLYKNEMLFACGSATQELIDRSRCNVACILVMICGGICMHSADSI